MNLRKGFFRLALVLSILIGIASSFWVLEDTVGNEDGIVYRCLPYELQIRISNEGKDRTTESYGKKIANPWDLIELRKLVKTHKSFGPDYILFWWRHLAVLSIPGFVAVWLIYGLTRWVFIPFITRGFRGSSPKEGKAG